MQKHLWGMDHWHIMTFWLYWNGNFLNHTLPDCINDSQKEFFFKCLLENLSPHIIGGDFPDGCIEMPWLS